MHKSGVVLIVTAALLISYPGYARSSPLAPSVSMVTVPGGHFQMGDLVGDGEAKERPAHEVAVKAFRLAQFDVTVGQFRQSVDATGYRTEAELDPVKRGCLTVDLDSAAWVRVGHTWRDPGYAQTDKYPVTCVSWQDAEAFITWLNKKTHAHYRLPSEAEWEYAARAGSQTKFFWGADPNMGCLYANGADLTPWPAGHQTWKAKMDCNDHYFYAAPVGSYRPNKFGLYDMVGNVWQWVQDCWHDSYVGAPSDGTAWESGDCQVRTSRGGSWHSFLGLSVSGRELGTPTSDRFGNQGFRLAESL